MLDQDEKSPPERPGKAKRRKPGSDPLDEREQHEEDQAEAELNDEAEEESVKEATKLSSKLIYEVIRRDGDEEMARPNRSLIWSGIGAGILISFSVLGEAVFRTYLPDTPQRFLVENLGYSLGFLLVILGRMQLFTENTITTVLPLLIDHTPRMLGRVARLWSIVLTANVVGALLMALLFAYTPAISEDLRPALQSLSEHAVTMPPLEGFFRGIPAGILIAAIVWMLPQAPGSTFFIILSFTWLIAAGDFTHVVAGSVEMWYLFVQGDISFWTASFGFFWPVLIGNVVGGTAIFTLLAWGQVKDEIRPSIPRA